mmetsp:Transcript_90667/g.235125  ORF Transcript_90667/g.235125 Transcript_90667/m.235125 type:complete len:221 (-) Transcript_90667:783-1445(-)
MQATLDLTPAWQASHCRAHGELSDVQRHLNRAPQPTFPLGLLSIVGNTCYAPGWRFRLVGCHRVAGTNEAAIRVDFIPDRVHQPLLRVPQPVEHLRWGARPSLAECSNSKAHLQESGALSSNATCLGPAARCWQRCRRSGHKLGRRIMEDEVWSGNCVEGVEEGLPSLIGLSPLLGRSVSHDGAHQRPLERRQVLSLQPPKVSAQRSYGVHQAFQPRHRF